MKRFGSLLALIAVWATPLASQDVTLSVNSDDEALERTLRQDALTVQTASTEDSIPQDIVAAALADYRRLLTVLYAYGYYGGTISILIDGREAATLEPLFAPPSIAEVSISVDTGPLFEFGTVNYGPMAAGATLPDDLTAGEPALSGLIQDGARQSVNAWRTLGHAKATVSAQDIVANHINTQLDVAVRVSPGPILTFGDLIVTGNEAVRTDAIERIAGFPAGEIYSPKVIETVTQRLRRAGAFESVSLLEADEIGPNDTLPVTAQVREAKPRRFGFSLEFSNVEGLKVSSFWMHRNALGGSERFRVEGEIAGIGGFTGGIDYRVATSLSIPAIYGPDTSLLGTASVSREDEPDYLLDRLSFGLGATRFISDDLVGKAGFAVLRAREETDLGTRSYTLLTLPFGFELDKRDDEKDAKSGYYIDALATPFIGLQGGAEGGRIVLDARAYRSIGSDDQLTFAARLQLGSLIGADIAETPADFLFYSGGGGTVRGQPYNDLGLTTDGITTGGTSFLGAQLEARYSISDSLGVVGFWDYGHIGDSSTPGRSGASHSGVGIGVRYDTFVGPLRLDVATPADGDDAFKAVEFYIGIGQAF